MTPEDVISQKIYADQLSLLMDPERSYDDAISILNLLAIAGYKLSALAEQDYDEEGISITSKAYMFAVVENIEGSHHNILNFKEERSDAQEDFEEDVDDDLDQDIWDDLGDED